MLERIVPFCVVAVFLADLLPLPTPLVALVLAIAAIAQAMRLWLWSPWRTLRVPMVWILHVGYLWIAVHLALRALSAIAVFAAAMSALQL